ncbi:MAG: pentapeptide repeat-containing protein [Oculatellaceae cyanobacterium Prado106]|nr:pentapeptide repeat-containing protein [Oculatellaceae cyanobacterium Prado106]
MRNPGCRGADLQHANLTESLATGADFTGAYFTGACLESWNTDSTTELKAVHCDFFYFLEHPDSKGNRERRPHHPDKTLKPGDFEKLLKEMQDLVQIWIRGGVQPEAFKSALNTILSEHPDAKVQGIETRQEDVLLTLEVPAGTDKGRVEQQWEEVYQARLTAATAIAQLEAEKRRGNDIKEIALSFAENKAPIHTQIANQIVGVGTAMTENTDQSQSIQAGRDLNITATNSVVNLRDISGTVTNTIQQLPASDGEQPGIKELLTELQTAIETDTVLSEEDKAEALEQVKVLAEAGQNPKDGALQKAAKTAMKVLKGTIATLPTATTLVESVTKLLPLITPFLGL